MIETFKVELYNVVRRGRTIGNGWGVARYIDGRRNCWVGQYGDDEKTARTLASWLNEKDEPK